MQLTLFVFEIYINYYLNEKLFCPQKPECLKFPGQEIQDMSIVYASMSAQTFVLNSFPPIGFITTPNLFIKASR